MHLVERLAAELELAPRQALGGAALLLQLAEESLSRAEFERVADAVPAISDVIAKAPRNEGLAVPTWRAWLSQWTGWGKLAGVVQALERLEVPRHKIVPFAQRLCEYFGTQGGNDVRKLLERVYFWR